MIQVFDGNSADEVWRKAVTHLVVAEDVLIQDGRGGPTHEILHALFAIRDPIQRWVYSRFPAMNPAFAIAEVVWIVRGRNDSAFLNYWNSQLPRFSGAGPAYDGAYGFRLRRQFGFDQLERAYMALKNNPHGRQIVLQTWDPRADFPLADGQPTGPDIPCNVSSLLKIRRGKLEWMQIVRSNDLFRGVPYNFVQFTTLQEILAGWLDVEVGSFNQLSDSLHVYVDGLREVSSASFKADVENTDRLGLTMDQSDLVFRRLELLIEHLIGERAICNVLTDLVDEACFPVAYQNLALLMCAESCRRRKKPDVGVSLMGRCTNPMLARAWDCWLRRFRSRC